MIPQKCSHLPIGTPVFIQAETARKTGDIDKARSLYLHVGRVAFWYRDWAGVLTGPMRIKQNQQKKSDHGVRGMLVQAMIAAEMKQSRVGIGAVGRALKSLGEDKGAVMALLRIRPNWPEGELSLDAAGDCWG